MSWFHASTTAADARNHASAAEIVACFRDQRILLGRLAFLITADPASAEQAVARACEITLHGNSPFGNWLLEWAKTATIAAAISLQGHAIRTCEQAYKDRRCPHVEHIWQIDDGYRAARLALIVQTDAESVITELDALCRAILVLRIAIRSSIQDCSIRLNVARSSVLAANCLVMTWLDYRQLKRPEDDNNVAQAL
jgi:hypothetical protein